MHSSAKGAYGNTLTKIILPVTPRQIIGQKRTLSCIWSSPLTPCLGWSQFLNSIHGHRVVLGESPRHAAESSAHLIKWFLKVFCWDQNWHRCHHQKLQEILLLPTFPLCADQVLAAAQDLADNIKYSTAQWGYGNSNNVPSDWMGMLAENWTFE